MNPRIIAVLVIIVLLVALLLFSPQGREFKRKYLDTFFSRITGKISSITGRITKKTVTPSNKLNIMITEINPSYMEGQSFDLKENGFNGKLAYESIILNGGTVSFPSPTVEVKTVMTGKISFEENKMKISGSADDVELNELKYSKTGIDFSIVGTPISYVIEVKEDKITFERISGSLSWEGLKLPPLLQDDKLDLIDFEGTVSQVEGLVNIIGKVTKIRLNGVDIGLGF